MENILFLIVLFISNVIQAITGFAGTVLAMPPSMFLLGIDDAKVVLNVMALLSGVMIAFSGRKHIRWKELGKMILLMLVGMAIGIVICQVMESDRKLLMFYGIIIILIALKNILIKKEVALPKWALLLILLCAGVIHGMYVSGGALLVIYAVQVLKEKQEFRVTVAPVWVVLNSFMLGSQIYQGQITVKNQQLILISIIPLIVATWLGTKIAVYVPQKVFLYITYVLLLVSGVALIVF